MVSPTQKELYLFDLNDVCEFESAVRHGLCVGNSLWASIRCKTIPHAWSISSKVMDSFVLVLNLSSSSFYLHNPNSRSFRPRGKYCRTRRKYWLLVHWRVVFLHYKFHMPNVLTSTEQKQCYYLLGSIFNCRPHHPLMAFNCEI